MISDLLRDRCHTFSLQKNINILQNGAVNPNSSIFNNNNKISSSPTPRITSVTSLVSPNEKFNVRTNEYDILKCKPLVSSIDRYKSKIFVISKQHQHHQKVASKNNFKTLFDNFKSNNSLQKLLNSKKLSPKKVELIDLTVEDEKQNVDLKMILKNRI